MTKKLATSANKLTKTFLLWLNSSRGCTTQTMRDIMAGKWQTPKRMTTPNRVKVRARFRFDILALFCLTQFLKPSCRSRKLVELWFELDVLPSNSDVLDSVELWRLKIRTEVISGVTKADGSMWDMLRSTWVGSLFILYGWHFFWEVRKALKSRKLKMRIRSSGTI